MYVLAGFFRFGHNTQQFSERSGNPALLFMQREGLMRNRTSHTYGDPHRWMVFASKLNMLIPVGVIIGAPFLGWLSDRFSLDKRKTLIVILTLYALTWVGVTFFSSQLWTVGLSLVMLLMGIVGGGFVSTLWGIVRDILPPEILGLTSGILNLWPFLGVGAFQVLTGAILDRAGRVGELYPLSGFKNAFLICLSGMVVCLVLSFFLKLKPWSLRSN